MQFRFMGVTLLAVGALSACGKKDKSADKAAGGSAAPATGSAGSAAPTPTPAPAGATAPLEATFEGKTYKFASAKIESVAGNGFLKLSTGTLTCGEDPPDGDTFLSMHVPKGPGGKHYAPGPVVFDIELYNGKQEFKIGNTLYGVLTTEPIEWKQGNKVKGTLSIADSTEDQAAKYTASGSFEAVVCEVSEDPEGYQATPEEADKTPASGNVAGKPFTFKSGIAKLARNTARGVDEITGISLFDAVVDCSNHKDHKGMRFGLGGSSGSSGKDVFLNAPQPRQLWWQDGPSNNQLMGPVWVKFDKLEVKAGGEITGSVYAEANPAKAQADPRGSGKISGTFTAKVCE